MSKLSLNFLIQTGARIDQAVSSPEWLRLTTTQTRQGRRIVTIALAAGLLVFLADPAMAQATGGGGDLTTFLQNIVNLITGTAGKLIAVLAICIVAIGALMGALSLRAMGGVILGVMLLFSASWIVNQITGGGI